jgi:pimeloyl-ACP methyl ester carboxylesterase
MCAIFEDTHTMIPQAKQVQLASGTLTYFIVGTGRPLVYLHPAGGVRWTDVLTGLARDRTLYVPVMPGFDETEIHPGIASMQALGALSGEFIDKVVGDRCDVIGQSFGGWVALWLAALRPERVDHLVLEGPAGFRPTGVAGLSNDPAAMKRALFVHPEKLPADGKTLDQEAANGKLRGHYNAIQNPDEALLAKLPAIDRITLILHGSEDQVVPKESVQLIKSKLSHAYLIYIWDAAHAIEVDQPNRVLALIQNFLNRSDSFLVNWGSSAVHPD